MVYQTYDNGENRASCKSQHLAVILLADKKTTVNNMFVQ